MEYPIRNQITFDGDQPARVSDVDPSVRHADPKKTAISDSLGAALKAYLNAAADLLQGKLSHLVELAPPHLRSQGNCIALICRDGLVVRFEPFSDKAPPQVIVGHSADTYAAVVAALSQNAIHCVGRGQDDAPQAFGIVVTLLTGDSPESMCPVSKLPAALAIPIPDEFPQSMAPSKPNCLASIVNRLEVLLQFERTPEAGASPQPGLMARSVVRVPLGWECIEIYPGDVADRWTARDAPLWAESDIHAGALVTRENEIKYQILDRLAGPRSEYARLLREFRNLLDKPPNCEQELQHFLEQHPHLLCPGHRMVLAKVPFGRHVSDFVFRDVDNHYLLVEIESSTQRMFRRNGHPTAELSHARAQTSDWARFIEDQPSFVRDELRLPGLSSQAQRLVVMGRSADLSEENRRARDRICSDEPRLRIATYDEILEAARSAIEAWLGPLAEENPATPFWTATS
jgi:hypothetical protein